MTEGSGTNDGQADSIIRFRCAFCGQQISVSSAHAGKKGRCPKCKNAVIVPQLTVTPQAPQEDEPIRLKRDDPPADVALPVPAPEQSWHRGAVNPADDVIADNLKTAPPPRQKPATILDMFTFPFSLAGAIHFLIFWIGPFLVAFFARAFVFAFYGQILIIGAFAALFGYLYYYLANCVIATAKDERLAPDVSFEETPNFLDLLRRVLLIIGSSLICFGPAIIYVFYFYILPFFPLGSGRTMPNWQTDPLYWGLYGAGIFFFPMFLLAAVMFDSITALNPLLIISSIISTLVPYCAIALLFFGVGLLMNYLGQWRFNLVLALFAWGADIYLMFIAAYILGRFFRRYESRLNWEVKL
jgi:phage FluMu protein Com